MSEWHSRKRAWKKETCQVKINWFSLNNLVLCTSKNDHTILCLGQIQGQSGSPKGVPSPQQGCRKPLVLSPVSCTHLWAVLWENKRSFDGNALTVKDKLHLKRQCISWKLLEYRNALKNTFESVLMRWMKLEPIYTEWSKPERKTPIQYTNAYIWNLERW